MKRRFSAITRLFYQLQSRILGKKPWPDFTKEEIFINNFFIENPDGEVVKEPHGFFPNIPPDIAEKEGWLKFDDYTTFADLEFSRRFPEHPVSVSVRKRIPYPDDMIEQFSREGLTITTNMCKIKKFESDLVKTKRKTK